MTRSNPSDQNDDSELSDEQLRHILGFRPREVIVDGVSLLAQFRGKFLMILIGKCPNAACWSFDVVILCTGKNEKTRDAYSKEFWENYVPRWEHLPDIVLEQIVSYLSIPDRHIVSQVD